jgi:hypothetical protein
VSDLSQLQIGGGEVPNDEAARMSRVPPLTPTQRRIIDLMNERGEIRSVEAGVIVHTARGHCGFGAKTGYGSRKQAIGCCAYAAADGLSAMHRLEERGLVRKVKAGRWRAR